MKAKDIKAGTITLSNCLYVTDPCYDTDTWCQDYIDTLVPGIYACTYTKEKAEDWGERISSIKILKEEYQKESSLRREVISHAIGVDSGQAGFFDASYYKENQPKKVWYDIVCSITLEKPCAGTIENKGFVSEGGIGDGMYTLYGYFNKEGKLVGLQLVFISYEESYD